MPAVAITKEQQEAIISKRFARWLKGQLAEQDLTKSALARELGMSRQALSYRFKNGTPFDYIELSIIFRFIGASDEVICEQMKKLA